MKKVSFIALLAILSFVSCQEDLTVSNDFTLEPVTKSGGSDSPADTLSYNKDNTIKISKWDALKIVEPITSKYPDRWVDVSNNVIRAGTKIEYSTYGVKEAEEYATYFNSPSFDSWLLVVGANLAINGRQTRLHLFVNIETGEVVEEWVNGMAVIDWDTSRDIYIRSEGGTSLREKPRPSPSRTAPNKWAVIISGGINKNENHMRFWNDCREAYTTLTQYLSYPANQIYCLISDGTDSGDDRRIGANSFDSSPLDFDGDGCVDINYSATKSNISTVFDNLGNLVTDGDEVLLFVADHGDRINNTSYICLWGNEKMSPSELLSEILKLGTGVSVDIVMGQCYSGGFTSLIRGANNTIITSAGATETSIGCPFFGVSVYDYFLYYWTEAIHNIDPSVSNNYYSNGDGYLSSFEIFKYAKAHTMADSNVFNETPQINNNGPDAFSWGHDLIGNNFVPYITGADYVSCNNNCVYTLSGLPSSYSRSWVISSDLTNITSNNNSITVKGNITSSSQFVSLDDYVIARFSDLGETIDVTKEIVSVWKPGQYLYCNHISGGAGVYYIGGYRWNGTYGFVWESGNDAWQITGQNDNIVYVSEGYTLDPVPLMVSFYNPLGEMIFVLDEVH